MTQAQALSILKTGANVFLTGEPGSGKTHIINQYVSYLRSCGIEPAITASTGIAATHISGMTIHSWSGIGVKRELTEYDLDHISQNERVVKRVARAKILIIDEVSMLSARMLSMVDKVCQHVRNSPRAFGGLQVVLVGDFFQLPPVVRREEEEDGLRIVFENAQENPAVQFACYSFAWTNFNPVVCYLTEQHRQEDIIFLNILSALRAGSFTGEHEAHLVGRRMAEHHEHKGVTKLFSHNTDVDRVNEAELTYLPGPSRKFTIKEYGAKLVVEQLKRSCLSPEKLSLKRGAKVMFTKNSPEGKFVNGTTGEVVGFDSVQGLPLVKTRSGRTILAEPMEWAVESEGKVLARVVQIPLRLAWAITVHKSQGMSLDAAFIDLTQAFEYGQGYVALSRVRTLDGLYLAGWNRQALRVHPDIQKKDKEFREASQAAEKTFKEISSGELAAMHKNFIRACGGHFPSQMPAVRSVVSSSSPIKKNSHSVEVLKKTYPNAYQNWNKKDDAVLIELFHQGVQAQSIAEEMGRQPGAIRSRVAKLGLE